jgi:hypothetical protein
MTGGIKRNKSSLPKGCSGASTAAPQIPQPGDEQQGGWHSLRHFCASWCINRRADGGLELPLKVVSTRLGHASIQMTAVDVRDQRQASGPPTTQAQQG